jgi:hypothetical protein
LFAQVLAIGPHLFLVELSKMVYEHLSRCFIPEDPYSRFLKLFQIVAVIAAGHILRLVALVLGVNKLLAMEKDIGGLCPIAIGEVFFQLFSHSIVL